MRIGIDCRLWDESGVGRYIRNLVRELQIQDKKNEYTLFVRNQDFEQIKSQISNLKYQIVRADIRWHSIEEQLRFPAILKKENLDLMHFPYFSVPILYNRPFAVTIHDLIIDMFPTGKASTLPLPFYLAKRLGYFYIQSNATKLAKKIITVSRATEEEIAHRYNVPREKIVVTYEGVDSFFRENVKEEKIPYPFFLHVGNVYPHKNADRLLEAIEKVNKKIKLVFVGRDGYFRRKLKEKVENRGLSERVIFMENVDDKKLVSLYKQAIALVIPSLMEGFGLPVIEAAATGCTVIVSNIAVFREICGETAVYIDPNNSSDIAEKMQQVIEKKDMYDLKKAQEKTKSFSWENMAKQTITAYEQSI